jgi:hypothetical protein
VSLKDGGWLPANHRYSDDVIGTLRKETPAGIHPQRLAEYIACSVPGHCFDGWKYLGRALQALLRGDTATCRHLAYYAELRAAICILAHEGIAVFDRDHFVVNTAGDAAPLRWSVTTHVAAAELLQWWSEDAVSGTFLSKVIRPAQESLGDWVSHFPVGTSLDMVAKQRLKEWGLDLTRLAADSAARNEASYRPRHMNPGRHVHPRRAARFTEAVWELLEPQGSRYFETLDRWLLRSTFEEMYREAHGSASPVRWPKYQEMVRSTVDDVVGAAQLRDSVVAALLDTSRRTPFVIDQVGRTANPGSPSYELQVLSRAVILLRLAAGAMRHFSEELGLDSAALEPWSTRIGQDLALWATMPGDLVDLWADVSPAVEAFAAWRSSGGSRAREYWGLRQTCSAEQVTLSQAELAPMWALDSL